MISTVETAFRQYLGYNLPNFNPSNIAVDRRVKQASVGALSAFVAFRALNNQSRHGEGRREQLARIFLKFGPIRRMYLRDLKKNTEKFANEFIKSWEQFGEPFREIPENGLKPSEVLAIINHYAQETRKNLEGVHMSGAIYGASLTPCLDSENPVFEGLEKFSRAQNNLINDKFAWYDDVLSKKKLSEEDYIKILNLILNDLYAEANKLATSWNSLHSDEFPIGGFLDFQLIQMVGNMFGADPNEVVGEVTSGGTTSILEAMIMYRNRAEDLGYIKPGEGVILGSKYSHAAFSKAASDHHTEFVEVASTSDGKMDTRDLERKIKELGKKVICVVASAPNYPTGTVDPIEAILKVTQKNDLPVHVDACLGGFVINFLDNVETNYLDKKKFPGVMSVSCDFHKFGRSPKGASIVIGYPELFKDGVRTVPDWSGGRYATLGPEGSKSCLPSLFGLATILIIGKSGYHKIAIRLRNEAINIKELLASDNRLEIIGNPDVSVVAFKLVEKLPNDANEKQGFPVGSTLELAEKLPNDANEKQGFPVGSTLELADQMKANGIILNKLRDDCVHMCVTPRFLSDPAAFRRFQEALEYGIAEVTKLREQGKIKEKDSGGYVEIAEMHNPQMKDSFIKYLQDLFFGIRAANDVLRMYFLYKSNPTILPERLITKV